MMTDSPPKIDNAPGLTWAKRKGGWVALWRARTDVVRNGYEVKSVPLWQGWGEPDADSVVYIQGQCRRLQDEMLEWSNGGSLLKFTAAFDGTWSSLIECYRTDPDSTYQTIRYNTRYHYDRELERIKRDHGDDRLADANAKTFIGWHRERKGPKNHVASAHTMVSMLRTVIGFGATMLEDKQSQRLREILRGLRFETIKPRTERITAEQADAVRSWAHRMLFHSVALAQALAFECTMRQKDVIGEYVPLSEPGVYDVSDQYGNCRWGRGLRWEEIDENFILLHTTSKKQKPIECDLRLAPMVLEELAFVAGVDPAKGVTRAELPAKGPIIIYQMTGAPFSGDQFRRQWRKVAKKAGVPTKVWNMDSRAGAISEAIGAGARLEHVRHAATHSDIGMTQKYDRGAAEATSNVMRLRSESRVNKK